METGWNMANIVIYFRNETLQKPYILYSSKGGLKRQ
jgi:hypothetical protein